MASSPEDAARALGLPPGEHEIVNMWRSKIVTVEVHVPSTEGES